LTGDDNKSTTNYTYGMESRALHIFESSIKSAYSRKQYKYQLNRFVAYYKLRDYDSILKTEPKQLQIMMEDYVLYLRTKLSPNSFDAPIAALQLFLELNDIMLNFKKIRKLVPARVKKSGERGYTTKEIQKMLEFSSDKRTKAVIHFIASSGVRVGAFDGLKLRHIVEMPMGCKAVLVYEGTTEEYWTFLTPEASESLDAYLNERRNDGETLTPDSPVFRSRYSLGVQKAETLSIQSITQIVYRVLNRAGLRQNRKNNRYEVQLDHGFRKRFNTILKLNREINANIVEKMMGHSKGLDGVYLKPTRQESFEEYKKGIPDLTIDDSERILAEKKKIEIERSELEKLKLQMDEQAKDLRQTRQDLEEAKKEFTRIKAGSEDPNKSN
jgi:integrase